MAFDLEDFLLAHQHDSDRALLLACFAEMESDTSGLSSPGAEIKPPWRRPQASIGRRRILMRVFSITTTAPASRSPVTAVMLVCNRDSRFAALRSWIPRNRRTEGLTAFRSASKDL